MERNLYIRLPEIGKFEINRDTYSAIKKAIRIYDCDRRAAAYAAAPHEGITPEIIGLFRRKFIAAGELPMRSFSRRKESPEFAHCGRRV
jgi:hypothetical protein